MSAATTSATTVKELVRGALQASKDHQYALKVYTERLEAELEAVDKLLVAAEAPEDEPDVDVGGHIKINGSAKAISPISGEVASGDHPFVADATQRQKYLQYTICHPMKASDFDALADAVRSENHRIHALAAQQRGQQPFVGLNDHPQSYFEQNKEGINWERVAQKVTAATSNAVQRTAQECEIRWLGERHPDFDRSQWLQPEIDKVKELIGPNPGTGEIDWVDIAAKLGTGRTPIDCMRHAIPRKTHLWTQESDQRLLDMVKVYGTESWQLVARQVSENATANQCQNRYTRSLDPQLRRGPWTQEEDDQLRRAVEIFGRSWVDVRSYVPTRSNEQCRDRWQDVLNPNVGKGKWSEDEDRLLLAACEELGEKWKEISHRVGGGRTDNMCRHRYALILKRKSKQNATSGTVEDASSATPEPTAGPSQSDAVSQPMVSTEPLKDSPRSGTPIPELVQTQVIKTRPKPRPRAKRTKGISEPGSGLQTDDIPPSSRIEGAPGRGSTPKRSHEVAQSEHSIASGDAAGPTPYQTSHKQKTPPRNKRGRPRKRLQTDDEAYGHAATKKRRTHTEQESEMDSGVNTVNPSHTASDVEDVQPEVSAASNPSQDLKATDSAQPPVPKRGRKKQGGVVSRPAPTRQSARLKSAREN